MIISFWLPKGGSCKTSLTLTMAGALASQGRRVLVVDRDPQGGALICAIAQLIATLKCHLSWPERTRAALTMSCSITRQPCPMSMGFPLNL